MLKFFYYFVRLESSLLFYCSMRSYVSILWESAGMFLGAKIGRLPKGVILMGWLLTVVLARRKVL
jgi:hypothetical protein